MAALDPSVLISEVGCYSCLGMSNTEALKLGLLSRIASVSPAPPVPPTPIVIPPIALNNLTSYSSIISASAFETGAYTPTPNALVLAVVCSFNLAHDTIPATITGNGLNWVLVETAWGYSNQYRESVYRAMGPAPTNTTLVVTFTSAQPIAMIKVLELTNVDTSGANGSGAIVQTNKIGSVADGSLYSANPSLNLAALNPSGKNAIIGFATNNINPFGGAPEAGWTLNTNIGVSNTYTLGLCIVDQLLSVDNSIAITAAISFWGMIGAEIKAQ